jgi:TonB family protein
LFLVAAFFLPQFCAASDLQDAINQQFKNKVLVLLHPSGDKLLRFDDGGKPAEATALGPWTVYSGVRIRKIHVQPNKLRIEGSRVLFRFGSDSLVPVELKPKSHLYPPPCQPAVEIDIMLNQPLKSIDQVQGVIGRVFAFSKEDFLRSVPAYWRAYVLRDIDFEPARLGEMLFKVQKPMDGGEESVMTPQENNGPEIFHVDKDVKRPRATYTPEPEFSSAARYEKYQGVLVLYVVVDKSGHIAQVKIVRPLGFGLDDAAATKIMEWRFDPAIRNGEPVAVAMHIEVAFHLY